ncbi:dihydropteroate synthase-like protein [Candidatus Acidianus copahuensis]|uniref:Dihydropteroate synthase n=1 Tax=Candidatus Acidianus copahuensis TaxID=1160895 RepID=A0A031LR15_9CREN|nr:dihydropteroate synthase-like protein [Candidatus Acidianus copahuensis]EZQ10827.1 dihydropteroate synthase [Candidatus Acidianus copahuensis]NON63622.1 dihydropteroate synthase-like protein [Acidianus sp. RZ1]
MAILLITGRLAAPIVNEVVKNVPDVYVKVLDYPVAALMSVKYILENLKKDNLTGIETIILPGLVFGDSNIIERELGIKTIKGTENAWDIPLVLEGIKNGINFSTSLPADVILQGEKTKRMMEELKTIEENQIVAFESGIKIPLRPPPFKIFLELDPKWGPNMIENIVERTRGNVDVYVLGFPVGHDNIDEVKSRIKMIRDLGVIVGIDSESTKELIEGVKAGADFVFNANEINYQKLVEVKNAGLIVAPFSVKDRSEITIGLAKKMREMGFEKIIVDPVLSPPLQGLVSSIVDFSKVRNALPDFPMMMGTLNVTELIDADSHGINALLLAIAGELGISSVLTMEKGKTRWSSWELKEASKMVGISILEKRPPKDVGIDLLLLKDKKKVIEKLQVDAINVGHNEPNMDSGFAKIYKTEKEIILSFYGKDKLALKGKEALSVGRELVRRIKITPEHALYLGYELAKAEIARDLDKNYLQDKPLFRRINDENSGT